MSYSVKHDRNAIYDFPKTLKPLVYTEIAALEVEAWITGEPIPYERRTSGRYIKLSAGDQWGQLWDCAWMHFTGKVPGTAKGHEVVLIIDIAGEGCVFDGNGQPVRGITTAFSHFFRAFGEPVKRVLKFTPKSAGNETVDIWIDCGCNDLFGNYKGDGRLVQASIAICREDIRQLYYDYAFLADLTKNADEENPLRGRIERALFDAAMLLTDINDETIEKASRMLRPFLDRDKDGADFCLSMIGHAHIDLAWLWPLRETKRKGVRTFSTVMEMMERYPEYVFGASQPQLFQWIKEDQPGLYEKIRDRIAEGRFECQGGMWVESDTNVPSGESLARQFLYGVKFFRREFGKDVKVAWLPDVFGFTASLPQIMKESGMEYFMTIKISWNEMNRFPHHTFVWSGLDGSEVLAHMPPTGDYVSSALPNSILAAQRNFIDKDVSNDALYLYGVGDGGGGPGPDHLERVKRAKKAAGLPAVKEEPAIDFFERIDKNRQEYKKWCGELYLDAHQGTLTTQAKNKYYNRKMEIALRECEFACVMAARLCGATYPQDRIEEIWKEVLLYQFHDILPGSSIKRVYDESVARYQIMLEEVETIAAAARNEISNGIDTSNVANPVVLFNSLSFGRTEWVGKQKVTIPAMGWIVVSADGGDGCKSPVFHGGVLENDELMVRFAGNGEIASMYDKAARRELVKSGMTFNRYRVHNDPGSAWDFKFTYRDEPAGSMALEGSEPIFGETFAGVRQTYRYGQSKLTVDITLEQDSMALKFKCRADWNETGRALRVSFPADIRANEASCEIQFGHIKRPTHKNTSWDYCRLEVAAHKWVDVSENGYGMALLNDCKYGHNLWFNCLDLCLLRSTMNPGVNADKGVHDFTYMLLPHEGTLAESDVIEQAYRLNVPYISAAVESRFGPLPGKFSFIRCDSGNIIAEAVKQAENGDGYIVRLYESKGKTRRAKITFDRARRVRLCSITEDDAGELTVDNNTVELDFKPFEIHTIRVNEYSETT